MQHSGFWRSWASAVAGVGLAWALSGALAAGDPASGPATAASGVLPPLPAEVFFRRDDISGAQLSPSGRWLAVTLLAADKRYALAVIDLDQPGAAKVLAYIDGFDVGRFNWVNDQYLVFSVYDNERGSGDQRYAPGLFSVGRDDDGVRALVRANTRDRMTTGTRIISHELPYNHRLLHVPRDGSNEVIVGEYRWDAKGDVTDVLPKRLDVVTGRATSLAYGTPPYITGWLFDGRGTPRVALSNHLGRAHVYWRVDVPGSDTPQWQQLADFEYFHELWSAYAVDAAGHFYVTAQEGRAQQRVLKRFDLKTGQPEPEAMVSTPGFDFHGGVIAENLGDRVLGVRVDTDAEQTVWFDPAMKALQAEIDRRLPGRINRLSCRRCGTPEATVLVFSYSDTQAGQYWIWRGPAAAPTMWRPVSARRRDFPAKGMATVDFQRFRARDGLEIPLWITLPAAYRAGQKSPTVVLVHGGPNVRGGHWDWEPWAQFLASRGYVVLAPEFRGSAGYGQKHLWAGFKQWGQAMQDDLADAVRWATEHGYTDPAKVCIAGASYGGYAVLMGLVRDPDVYRCGAAWVAVTEPSLLFKSSWASDLSEEGQRYLLPVTLGDPVADAEMLRRISPVQQAARIKAPLLLAYGAEDRRVPIEHGNLMRDALKAAGQEPEFVVYPGEGHGWLLIESNLDFARRLERFLARNLR